MLLAVAIVLARPFAFGGGIHAAEMTREEALAGLAERQDVERRRDAARVLGERGQMADVPRLVDALRDPDDAVRAGAERSLWQIWSRSGDAEVDRLLAIGIEQMQANDGDAAVATFTRVIERRPDFAEGWNKRATVYYLLGEYEKSLADCDEVMKRNPWHFGALSGYGMIYVQLGQPERALDFFERALRVNPNLDSVREAVETLQKHLIQRRRNTL
ncbi:MAG: tetratricopeptide repeat protein [Candidatus Rokubacteria bacterium]|nr:tetratricopeptide repeat protein [Candidatus Rokubacteria bacterium]